MMKTLLILFIAFNFIGCTTTKYVYLEPKCPKIQVLDVVPKIDGNVKNGCVCGKDLKILIQGTKALRASESYYNTQVTEYNDKFTNLESNLTY